MKKYIIGTLMLLGAGAPVHAARQEKSPAYQFKTWAEVSKALDDLVIRYENEADAIEVIRRDFQNKTTSKMALKLKMLKTYATLPAQLKTEVGNLFGYSPAGYEYLLSLAHNAS